MGRAGVGVAEAESLRTVFGEIDGGETSGLAATGVGLTAVGPGLVTVATDDAVGSEDAGDDAIGSEDAADELPACGVAVCCTGVGTRPKGDSCMRLMR
jgi:hypothetical protein